MPFPSSLPTPRTLDPLAVPRLRWGILGPGWIAERFVPAVRRHTRQDIVAVAGRDPAKATAFAGRFGIAAAHPSVEALVADAGVGAVYVATPHHRRATSG